MCRWNAYYGQPLIIDELLFQTEHGLIDQSLHSRMGVETTNGDGFGLGWYGELGGDPCRYRTVTPAWSDVNLRDMASHIESPLWLAHIRATTGTPVQQTNCHPFQHGRWLFVHNGVIAGFHLMRRELLLAVDPELFDGVEGSTDSEVLFHLALTYGLEHDPAAALELAIGFVEATAVKHGIENAVQTSLGVTDGERLWAFRYSTEHKSRTLFASTDATAVRRLHPDNPTLQALHDEDRVVVSEPLSDLPGLWKELPESTVFVVQPGADEERPFRPHYEPASGNGASVPAASSARR